MAVVLQSPRRRSRQLIAEVPRLLGGLILGLWVGCVVLAGLSWAAMDHCANEPAVPVTMVGMVLSLSVTACATVVHMVEARALLAWGASIVVWLLAVGLWLAVVRHAAEGASDCTWRINPPVVSPGGG